MEGRRHWDKPTLSQLVPAIDAPLDLKECSPRFPGLARAIASSAFHQQDVGFFLAEGGVPCASSIMAQHACVPGESWYHLRLLDWGLWRHQRRVEREVSEPGYTSWVCLCHLGSHLHLGRHLCCGTDVSLSQHQPSGWHRHTLVDICLLLPGGMDAFLCSGPDSRIPGVHVGNPSQFGHCHSAHRLPARDLPEGVLLAEGTFFIALWMDHRRECLEYQRPCRLLHVIARDIADVSHGALTARGGRHLCFSMCFIVFPFFVPGYGIRILSTSEHAVQHGSELLICSRNCYGPSLVVSWFGICRYSSWERQSGLSRRHRRDRGLVHICSSQGRPFDWFSGRLGPTWHLCGTGEPWELAEHEQVQLHCLASVCDRISSTNRLGAEYC